MKQTTIIVAIAALLVTAVLAGPSYAVGLGTGKITKISASGGTNYVAIHTTSYTGYPACATGLRFYVDLTSQAGKDVYALAMTAMVSGTDVEIGGTGTCPSGMTGESISYISAIP